MSSSITSLLIKGFYVPKDFINHAASLHQTFVHCGRFSTAATRRCMGRVSVPSVGVRLSPPLRVIALVVHYTTNKLIRRRLFQKRPKTLPLRDYRVLAHLSVSCSRLLGTYPRVTTSSATNQRCNQDFNCIATLSINHTARFVRLACLIHAASVHPELGSNSSKKFVK